MASYRAKMQLFVDGSRIRQGKTFESDLAPGKQWEPLDAAAKAAYDKAFPAKQKRSIDKPAKPEVKAEAGSEETAK